MSDFDPTHLAALPLFPLQTVLFPGGVLPLQIFEVRYLDMVGRCHKAGTPFGIVSLTRGSEVRRPAPGPSGDGFAHEAFETVGTLAQIEHFERPQPGLMRIRCRGTQRFTLSASEQLKHGLWVGRAALLDDDAPVPVPQDLAFTCDGLQRVLRSMTERVAETQEAELADLPLQPPYRWDDCGWLANRWCELLPLPAEMKQRLMALDNPLLRLELVADVLSRSGAD